MTKSDERYEHFKRHQDAARAMLAALKMARMHVALSRVEDHLAVIDAAIAQAEAAGIA